MYYLLRLCKAVKLTYLIELSSHNLLVFAAPALKIERGKNCFHNTAKMLSAFASFAVLQDCGDPILLIE